MIGDTISKIEQRLSESDTLSDTQRREMLDLLVTLKIEVSELSKTDADQARSITSFVMSSAHEAMRGEKKPAQLKHSLAGLSASVEGFERSHPQLVQIVGRICTTLSNIGI